MKILSTFCFLLIAFSAYSQQFNFNQLIEMTNDNKVFEIRMIKALNQMYKKKKNILYSYSTIDGSIGCTNDIPTNNLKYEPKYKFSNGQIYTESEINDNNLDESFEIRNKLRAEGGFVNELEVEGYNFQQSKIISLIKSEDIEISFAEDYDSEEKTAFTWYKWESTNYKKVLIQSKLFSPSFKKLTINYVRNEDFSNILSKIISVSNYIDTNEEYGSFISNYKYGLYSIKSERHDNGNGGIITIYLEQK
jgi:hypothetical protein